MFYIIEKQEQLNQLPNLGDCFIHFIGNNDNFHPKLQDISLIYLKPLNNKGYILCINHTESFSLNLENINSFLYNNTNNLFTLNKKYTLYFCDLKDKLKDIYFIKDYNINISNICYDYFYNKFPNNPVLNNLIPISKHYEKYNNIFESLKDNINSYNNIIDKEIYDFNNNELTEAFWNIEKNGIKLEKNSYKDHFGLKTKYHEFNIKGGKIYTHYNLHTVTGRPSNKFNNINFAALNKNNNERKSFIPENHEFIEFDYTAFHPYLAAKLSNFDLSNITDFYKWLNVEKSEVFHQLYGGIDEKNLEHPYFKAINNFTNYTWQSNKYGIMTKNRYFNWEKDGIDSSGKMLSYLLQSYETYYCVKTITKITEYLQNKKSKLILTTYDSFLIDYHMDDGNIKSDIKTLMEFPSKIKCGKNYNNLEICQDS